jgi:hypothetical protein
VWFIIFYQLKIIFIIGTWIGLKLVSRGSKPETISHTLVECELAIQFWHRLKKMFEVKLPTLHQATWSSDLTGPTLCDDFSAAAILCGMWLLWKTRSDLKHGKNTIPVRKAIDWALDTATHLLANSHPTKEKSRRQHIKWRPPPLGVMKVNVDVAFNMNTTTWSIGAIMRDEAGHFHAAEAWFLDLVASVMVAEAEACRQRMQLAKDAGTTSIIIETNSKLVVDLW